MAIYEGWVLAYTPASEYLMNDDRQTCFTETVTHVLQILTVPGLKGYE
jgi:hypothetical protein